MKLRLSRTIAGLCTLCLPWLLACSSTGVGNPGTSSTGTLSLAILGDELEDDALGEGDAEAAELGDAGAGSGDAGVVDGAAAPLEPLPRGALERALLVLGSVRWIPCDEAAPVITQSGPFIVDLLAGETRPPLPAFDVPEGGLCGLQAPLAPARGSAEILGRSLWFAGTRADGVRFVLFANMRATLRARPPRGQVWGGDGDRALLWAMRPRRWAAARELNDAEATENEGRRTIVIAADRHPLLYAAIRARLASESALYLDQDGDGALTSADRAPGAIGTATTEPED